MKNKTKQTLIRILLVVFVITALFSVAWSDNTLVNILGINNVSETSKKGEVIKAETTTSNVQDVDENSQLNLAFGFTLQF